MVGDIEALGALTTAGLAASVIEGPAGHAGEPHGSCVNCHTPLFGRFCTNCGQSAHIHRTVGHLLEEFTHGLLHVDTKAWRTLPKLVFQPGKLTREYVHGKRARYIAPLAMFLFTIFLMFFVFGFIADSVDPNKAIIFDEAPKGADAAKGMLAEAREDLKDAEAKMKAAAADPDSPPGLEGRFAGEVAATQAKVAVLSAALERAKKAPAPQAKQSANPTWQDKVRAFAHSDDLDVNLGSPELNKRIRHTLENPDLALYKIQQKASKLSFLLVPLSLPFMWLLFPFRRGVNMYDHTVFALYSVSFMSLLVVTAALMLEGPPFLHAYVGWLVPMVPLHMYLQLKGAYQLGWLSAIWRTLWLLMFSGVTLAVFALIILVLGLID